MKKIIYLTVAMGLVGISTAIGSFFMDIDKSNLAVVNAQNQTTYECSITYFPDFSVVNCSGTGSDCKVVDDCSSCWPDPEQ